MFSHEYNLPVFIGTGSVATSGDTASLKSGQIGIFDSKTYNAVSGAIASNKAMIVAGGSWHTKSKLNKFVGNLTASDKTIDFLGKDILSFEKSLPREAQSEQWVIGWDGVSTTDTLDFDCGKDYHFKVRVWGEDVYGTFLRPVDRFIRVRTECCVDGDCATDDCSDAVPQKKYAKLLAKAINEDPELMYFVRAEIISSDYAATTATHALWTLSVVDDGSQAALAAVQVAFPDLEITRVSRTGLTSVYEACVDLTDSDPADYTPGTVFSLAECDGTCPAGTTAVAGSNVYIVSRPLAGSEDLSGSTPQQTYADLIGTAYEAAAAITFDGATDVEVVAASDAITITAHGLKTGDKVTYADGGGTQVVGLTDGTDYFVINATADTVKLATTLANALAGTAIAISDGVGAAHTLTPVITAKFLSNNGAVATVELSTPAGFEIDAALSSDIVTLARVVAPSCSAAGSAISWVEGDERYKVKRTLVLTLEKECGTANRLAELQAFYANDASIDQSTIAVQTAGTCNDIYEMEQWNDACSVDNCLSEALVTFAPVQSFEGFEWTEDEGAAGSTTIQTGVRIVTAYEDTRFGGCSFNPSDYYSVRPLKLQIQEFDDSGNPCRTPIPSRKLRNVSMATQSGEWVIREFIRANRYRVFGEFYNDPRLREALDANIHEVVDRNKNYKLYFLKVRQNRLYQNHNADFSPEIFEFMFAFPMEVDTAAFELAFEKVTSQFGVFLQDR
jgi:hypothetical protein